MNIRELFSKKNSNNIGKIVAGKLNMVIFIVVVVAISVFLNLIIEKLPAKVDMTTEKLFSLTEITDEVLSKLEEKVTVYALFDRLSGEKDSDKSDVIKVLDLYDSNSKVEVKYVNIDQNPSFLTQTVGETNASSYTAGDFIVKCGDRIRRIASSDMYVTQSQTVNYIYTYTVKTGLQAETKLTSAIVKVTSDVPVIYYDTSCDEQSMSQFSTILKYIENSGFDFMAIDLIDTEIPENCAALFFIGPTKDMTAQVEDKVERWMMNGGKAFFFMDALNSSNNDGAITASFDNFSTLLKIYGIGIGDSIVKESGDYAVATSGADRIFYTNTITAGCLENLANTKLYIRNTRNLTIDTMVDMAEPEAILETTVNATATSLTTGAEKTGKQVIGVSSKYSGGKNSSYVVVFGSSQTIANNVLTYFGDNAKTIMKQALNWMKIESGSNVGDSISAKSYNDGITTAVTVSETQKKVIAVFVMVIVPLVVISIGFIVWLRRRHL